MAKPPTRKMKAGVRAVVEWAAEHGWRLDGKDGGGHWVLRHPKGWAVRLPDTPSEGRGLANAKAQIRRLSGLSSDSGPAAKYRHESRRERFDMDAAVREARLRRAYEEVAIRNRLFLSEELDRARAELAMIDPRREPLKAREAAAKVLHLRRKLNSA